MSCNTAEQVPTGPYFGFTLAELDAELARYKVARASSGSDLANASVNGQNYGWSSTRRDWSLDQWSQALQEAYFLLDPGRYPLTPTSNAAVAWFA